MKFSLFSPKQLNGMILESFINILEGSVRSGKTISSIVGWMNFIKESPYDEFLMSGSTSDTLYRNVISDIETIYGPRVVKYVGSSKGGAKLFVTVRHDDGTKTIKTCYCVGAHNEQSEKNIRGMTIAGWYADEITLHPESFVKQGLNRMSLPGAKAIWTTNPDTPFHFIKTEFIDQAKAKGYKTLHFHLEDNYSLTEEYKETIRNAYTGIWYDRMIKGLWVLAEGAIYDFFKRAQHVISNQEQQQKIIENAEEWYVSNDYGTGTVFVLGLFCVSGGKRYLVKSFWWDAKEEGFQKSDSDYARDLLEFIDGYPISAFIIPDDALSFIAELYNFGVQNVFVYERLPGSVMDGIRTQSMYLSSGEYKILDHPTNEPVIKEYSAYVWDEKAQKKGEDKPVKENDHGKDMERYFHDGLNQIKALNVAEDEIEVYEGEVSISPY